VWLPPLAMGLWLLIRWRLPGDTGVPDPGTPDPDRGESTD